MSVPSLGDHLFAAVFVAAAIILFGMIARGAWTLFELGWTFFGGSY